MKELTNLQRMTSVINPRKYRKNILNQNMEKHLLKSEEDIEKGRTKSARKVFEELEKNMDSKYYVL